ncbi:MAG TPA: ATP-binding protein [Fibrobacteria bacterium]|nr:ATP-binding protein [Fibrobacteria bacterium]
MTGSPRTFFLSAERSSPEESFALKERFERNEAICDTLHLVPNMVLILDRNRQIVYANKSAATILQIHRIEDLIGGRFGEVWGCVHAREQEGGCGTSESCRYCGAANALAQSLDGMDAVEECRLLIHKEGREESIDLRVWAKPIRVGGEDFLFFSAVDIADEKRKAFLERIFLHDILNTAAALKGFTNLLGMEGVSLPKEEMIRKIGLLSEQMIDEINAHRLIIAAENNELVVQVRELSSRAILEGVLKTYDHHETLGNRSIRIAPDSEDAGMVSDPTLLSRVVGNMAKNALEASVPGDVVTLESRTRGDRVEFRVHNPAYMPEKIRLQVFQRSFSTKGSGRGLGTYSMKYLTENYLRGRIGFTSTEPDGTVFVASYPRHWLEEPIPGTRET